MASETLADPGARIGAGVAHEFANDARRDAGTLQPRGVDAAQALMRSARGVRVCRGGGGESFDRRLARGAATDRRRQHGRRGGLTSDAAERVSLYRDKFWVPVWSLLATTTPSP